MLIYTGDRLNRRPQGKLVEIVDAFGKKKSIRLRKSVPKKCSTPRQICIRCLSTVIHKNSLRFDSKVCEGCDASA